MLIKLQNYASGYRIVSLALDEHTKDDLLKEGLQLLYLAQEQLLLLPDKIVLSADNTVLEQMSNYNNYDVFEIWEDGIILRKYDDKSGENYFYITGACNSNCIMCPSPEHTRKKASDVNVNDLIELARHIPADTPHLTITGGEPFLIGHQIFPFIQFLKEKFVWTEFLFLTNGRIFSIEQYVAAFVDVVPANTIVAIPVHGSCEAVHDTITRTDGSFYQTKQGIKQLLRNGIRVELRLVLNKINVGDFENIADLIIHEFKGIEYVSIIAMEMTGEARKNMNKVWMPYKESFSVISPAIREMIQNGIDVRLYNFPICTVEKPFWTLCEKSISTNKVRFADNCEMCKYKNICGGVFSGTLSLEKEELKPIL